VPHAPAATAPRPKLEQVEQIGEEFVPKVKAILVGSPVSFPNRDSVRHHVYSFSPPKRFDLPLYVGTPTKPVVFDKPGVVVLGCNIHDWMIGYVYVSESPYYATTADNGEAIISGMPAGDYTVRVWHPQLADVVEDTRRKLDASETADMLWRVALKPEVRIRRAPTSTRRGPY
jgi:plastocyanin